MKKALVIIGICLLVGYLVFSAFYFQGMPQDGLCSKFEVEIKNGSEEDLFIDAKDIEKYIKEKGVENIDIKASIEERKPILRVISNSGENYYIDNEGQKMPLSQRFTAYLPIATGIINENFAKRDLYKFALFLYNNKFWNAQIEQIVVLPNKDIKLIPRVGDHEIILGSLAEYEKRLEKLMTFYENGLNETGWNKYSVINLKFDKQVVCTRR